MDHTNSDSLMLLPKSIFSEKIELFEVFIIPARYWWAFRSRSPVLIKPEWLPNRFMQCSSEMSVFHLQSLCFAAMCRMLVECVVISRMHICSFCSVHSHVRVCAIVLLRCVRNQNCVLTKQVFQHESKKNSPVKQFSQYKCKTQYGKLFWTFSVLKSTTINSRFQIDRREYSKAYFNIFQSVYISFQIGHFREAFEFLFLKGWACSYKLWYSLQACILSPPSAVPSPFKFRKSFKFAKVFWDGEII